MYAVIESGGKQYRVTLGDRLKVESLKLDPGSKLSLDKVLLVADEGDIKVGGPYLGSKVEATVIGHGRGEKIRIFKLRRRKNSRQQAGHRQNFTELEIISIAGKSGDGPDKAAKKAVVEEKAAPDAKDQEIDKRNTDDKAPAKRVAKKAVESGKTTKKKSAKKKVKQKAAE